MARNKTKLQLGVNSRADWGQSRIGRQTAFSINNIKGLIICAPEPGVQRTARPHGRPCGDDAECLEQEQPKLIGSVARIDGADVWQCHVRAIIMFTDAEAGRRARLPY
jgi:hypothetical protein